MSKSQACGMTDESGDKLCGCSPVRKCLNHYSLNKKSLFSLFAILGLI